MKTLRSATLTRATKDREVVDAPSFAQRVGGVLPFDLLLEVTVAWLTAIVVLLDGPTPLRIVLGLPFIFFFPGYAVVALLFPSRDGVDGVERIALAFGVSVALVPLIALVLDRSRWSIALTPIVVALLVVTTIAGVLAGYRRARYPPIRRYTVTARIPTLPPFSTWDRQTRLAMGLMAIAFVLLVAGGASAVVARFAGEPTTEFALFSADGKAQFYERQVPVGEAVEALLSITNREGHAVTYEIRVAGDGVAVGSVSPIAVKDGETGTVPIRFTVHQEGDQLPVYFELWRTDRPTASHPYRTLRLMVDGVTIVQ